MPDSQTIFDPERSAGGDTRCRGFVFHAAVRMEDILRFYAPAALAGEGRGQCVGDFVARALHACPLEGDRVTLGPLEFVVLDAVGVHVEKVGVVFRPAALAHAVKGPRKHLGARTGGAAPRPAKSPHATPARSGLRRGQSRLASPEGECSTATAVI